MWYVTSKYKVSTLLANLAHSALTPTSFTGSVWTGLPKPALEPLLRILGPAPRLPTAMRRRRRRLPGLARHLTLLTTASATSWKLNRDPPSSLCWVHHNPRSHRPKLHWLLLRPCWRPLNLH